MGDLTVEYIKPRYNRKKCQMCGKKPKNGKLVVIEKFASSNTPVFRPEIQNESVEE